MGIEQLEKDLEGRKSVNLNRIAGEHFTPGFLEAEAGRLMYVATMAADLGMPVQYNPPELEKCVVHFSARRLIGDLWKFSIPKIKPFVTEEGRFDLDRAVTDGKIGKPSKDIEGNLVAGFEFVYDLTSETYAEWLEDLKRRYQEDPHDPMATLYRIYKAHSVLISGGDWQSRTILDSTFTSAGKERFNWMREHPDLSRAELEKIVENSREGSIEQASLLGIKSTAKEGILREATARGELAYVLDPDSGKIIFNPDLLDEVAEFEEDIRDSYSDQTQLVLKCPARFVPSPLYHGGSMLHDQIRFKESVYVELYLATHGRR